MKRTAGQKATIVGVFVFGVLFMFSVAKTSYRELFDIPPIDVPFNTVIPSMMLTYVPMIVIIMIAMRGRRHQGSVDRKGSE